MKNSKNKGGDKPVVLSADLNLDAIEPYKPAGAPAEPPVTLSPNLDLDAIEPYKPATARSEAPVMLSPDLLDKMDRAEAEAGSFAKKFAGKNDKPIQK